MGFRRLCRWINRRKGCKGLNLSFLFYSPSIWRRYLEAIKPSVLHTLINFKTMTTINTGYSNTELLDQELTDQELSLVSGGLDVLEPTTPEEEEELREVEAWWLKRSGR